MQTTRLIRIAPWVMLISRTMLFALFQLLIAGFLAITGSESAWDDSAGWWTFSVLFTNLVIIALLIWLHRLEGERYLHYARFARGTFWKDLGIALLVFIASAPLSTLPNIWLANLLLGSSEAASALFFRPMPLWAGLVSILFPLTIAFAEMPTYFGYCMPRLKIQLHNGWLAWAIASFFLAFQHVAIPLILDWRFMLWRIGMFIPFAFFVGLVLKLRPSLFPFLLIGHALIDMSLVAIILSL